MLGVCFEMVLEFINMVALRLKMGLHTPKDDTTGLHIRFTGRSYVVQVGGGIWRHKKALLRGWLFVYIICAHRFCSEGCILSGVPTGTGSATLAHWGVLTASQCSCEGPASRGGVGKSCHVTSRWSKPLTHSANWRGGCGDNICTQIPPHTRTQEHTFLQSDGISINIINAHHLLALVHTFTLKQIHTSVCLCMCVCVIVWVSKSCSY